MYYYHFQRSGVVLALYLHSAIIIIGQANSKDIEQKWSLINAVKDSLFAVFLHPVHVPTNSRQSFHLTFKPQTHLFIHVLAAQENTAFSFIAEAKDLIRRLLIVDQKMRYTAVDVLTHPWVVTVGGSKELPEHFTDHQKILREEILEQGRKNMAEWRQNRQFVFANHKPDQTQI